MKYLKIVQTDAELINPKLDNYAMYLSKETGAIELFGNSKSNNEGQPNTEIWYTTSNGNKLEIGGDEYGMQGYIDAMNEWYNTTYNGPTIIEEVFEDGMWKIKFGSTVTRVGASIASDGETTGYTIYPFFDGYEVGTNIVTISLPSSVTVIDNASFRGCVEMASFIVPSSVTRIESQAFMLSGLESLTIPVSVTYLGEELFYECSLREITYKGTQAQWNAITKDENWNYSGSSSEPLAVSVIHCTNGDITL